MPLSCALVTPSFRLDFDRCAWLTESVSRFVPEHVRHYIVVDRRDLAIFRPLSGPRTKLLVVEDIVPWWISRIPRVQRFWWSWRSRPIKNWILQQIVKLSVANIVREDVLYFVDSDVFFAAPFDPHALERDGKVPLFVEEGKKGLLDWNDAWHGVAARLLGLPVESGYDTNYIGNVIGWRRENVRSLEEKVEEIAKKDWELAIAPLPKFSEYILYGLYAMRCLKQGSGHYVDSVDRTLTYWDTRPLGLTELASLRERIQPEHHSVMISAKSRTPVADIRKIFAL
jgi:Family of unknown function (DUF6492)